MDLRIKGEKDMVVTMSEETYLDSFLPSALENAWDDPDQLKAVIKLSIEDGLYEHVEKAALHLLEIEPEDELSWCLYGVILTGKKCYKEAENYFLNCLKKLPNSIYLLVNLSNSQFKLNKDSDALSNLEKAISIDPEHELPMSNMLGYKMKKFLKEGYDENEVYLKALQEALTNYRSTLLIIWLGSFYIKHNEKEQGLAILKKVLTQEHTENHLFTISGELATNGFLKELIDWIGPRFDPMRSRCETGYNLLQAHYQLWRIKEGKQILDKMQAVNKPETKEQLLEFEEMYKKAWWKEYFKNFKK